MITLALLYINASVNSSCAQGPPPTPFAFTLLVSPGGWVFANFVLPSGQAFANPGALPKLLMDEAELELTDAEFYSFVYVTIISSHFMLF